MIQQGVYRHYKGGLYTVLMVARCSDNGPNDGADVVVYVSHATGQVYTRMASEFFGRIVKELAPDNIGSMLIVDRFEFVASSLSPPTGAQT